MLAVVKKYHTKKNFFEVKGNIPSDLIKYLKNKYWENIEVLDEEEVVNIFDTKWYKDISSSLTPGGTLNIYRKNLRLSQTELGKKLEKLSRQKISDMENGRRSISKEVARKLSNFFKVPTDRFI